MRQYLTFTIANQVCAVALDNVESVLANRALTPVPGHPGYVNGLLSLEGDAVPVVDVKRRLGLGSTEREFGACIIVLSFRRGGRKLFAGALVEAVCEVAQIDEERIGNIGEAIIRGIGKRDERLVRMLSIEELFPSDAKEMTA
jgi:purine-binding chemotaxis protein CheW